METFEWIKLVFEDPEDINLYYSDKFGLLLRILYDNNIFFEEGPTGFYGSPPKCEPTNFPSIPVASVTTNSFQPTDLGKVTLLHEIGHHMCGHQNRNKVYRPEEDAQFFSKEIEAWNWARKKWRRVSQKQFPYEHEKYCLGEYYNSELMKYHRSGKTSE